MLIANGAQASMKANWMISRLGILLLSVGD
jgi:hypothetical protein